MSSGYNGWLESIERLGSCEGPELMGGGLQVSIGTAEAQVVKGRLVAGSTSGPILLGMSLVGEGSLDLDVRLAKVC